MSSLDQPAVEALLTQWESRHPGTPVRAVVDRATELGFVPTPPGGYGTADYLRLVFTEQSQRAVTLYVNGLRLTAAGSAARKVAATLPGAVVKSRDVQLPFTAANPFAALDTFRRVATGKLVAPPGPAPVRHDTGQLEFLPATSLAMASPRPSAAPASLRRRGVLALVAALVLLLVVTGAASGGLGGALVTLGLAVVLVGFAAVVVGRARWAFIATRGVGGIVAAAGVAVLAVGSATLPTPEPASAAQAAPAATSAAPPGIDPETATVAAEAALVEAETEEAARTATDPGTGLLGDSTAESAVAAAQPTTALAALAAVPVQGRAAKTGYDRDLFGAAWADVDRNGCDTRNDVLARDLSAETFKPGTRDCVVLTGSLADPYSGTTIAFQRGQDTSDAVQIDHVVALSNSWQTGAQGWDVATRTRFANDQLNLLAVDGPLNMQKGDGDAATWLPPNKGHRCAYVARQVAVKISYGLWMTQAERNAIATVLSSCPAEPLPGGVVAAVPPRPAATSPAPVAPQPVPQPVPEPRTAVVVPAPAPAPVPAPAPAGDVYYQNCDAVRAAGAAPIHPGDPGWQPKFDRDQDGVGCDS